MNRAFSIFFATLLGVFAMNAAAQEGFDACEVFTAQDAEAALGTQVQEATVFKGKRPKVVPECKYTSFKDGKAAAATVHIRVARTEADAKQSFADARLEMQTKPLVVAGNEAFWAGKSGMLHMRKGRVWMTVAIGPDKPADRDMETARKTAEALAKKL